ncbi:DNA-binding protein [Furfurilactobacillus entadae]|uniref:DNA-binding protein n=1 Tax=Furfurilactobacillus entadae TaxID=2922307 RepID=UPI0035E78AC4
MQELRVPVPVEVEAQLKAMMMDAAKEAFTITAKRQALPRYMTKTQATEYLQCSFNTLQGYIAQGLRVITVGNNQRIDKVDADKFYSEHKM